MACLASLEEVLVRDFPDTEVRSIQVIGEGWEHVAIEVNGDRIFRIPSERNGVHEGPDKVRREISVLGCLAGRMPVSVPRPRWVAPAETYYGYPKLTGTLADQVFNGQTPEVWVHQWVEIATAVHSLITLDQAREFGVEDLDPEWFVSRAERVTTRQDLPEFARTFARETLAFMDALLSEPHPAVFIHNDLHFQNLLVDPTSNRITGVIDWSDCVVGPIEKEFSVLEWHHDGSLELAVDLYVRQTGVSVSLEGARAWRHLEELADLWIQSEAGNLADAQRSLDHISSWIRAREMRS